MEECVSSSIGEELRCYICLETLVGAVCVVPCMHRFCGRCVEFWARRKKTCPVCRSAVRMTCRDSLVDRVVESLVPSPYTSPRTIFVTGASLLGLRFRGEGGCVVVCGGKVCPDLMRGERILAVDGVTVSDPSLLLSMVRERGEGVTFKACLEERFRARADSRLRMRMRSGVVEVEEGCGSLVQGDFVLSFKHYQGATAMRMLQASLLLFPFHPCCVVANRETTRK